MGIVDTGPVFTAKASLARRLADLRHFAANAPSRLMSRLRTRSFQEQLALVAKLLRRASFKTGATLHLNKLEYPLCDVLDEDDWKDLSSSARTRELAHLRAFCKYAPGAYSGEITLFRAQERPLFRGFTPDFGWRQFPVGTITIRPVPGDHKSMLSEPHCQVLARQIIAAFAEAIDASGSGSVEPEAALT